MSTQRNTVQLLQPPLRTRLTTTPRIHSARAASWATRWNVPRTPWIQRMYISRTSVRSIEKFYFLYTFVHHLYVQDESIEKPLFSRSSARWSIEISLCFWGVPRTSLRVKSRRVLGLPQKHRETLYIFVCLRGVLGKSQNRTEKLVFWVTQVVCSRCLQVDYSYVLINYRWPVLDGATQNVTHILYAFI